MRRGARGERVEVVAAFERGDDATLAMARRHGHEALGDPGIVLLDEHELRQRIGAMRVEAGRDENDVGAEILERGQDELVIGPAELYRSRHLPQRHVDDVADARFTLVTGTRIEMR